MSWWRDIENQADREMFEEIETMNDKEKDKKPKEQKPSIPVCPVCNQNMIHCKCSANELKK
jgi:hypothetical protein